MKNLKVGESIVVVADNIWSGHPEQLVTNPNPNGRNKYITRRAAQQWLRENGEAPQSAKPSPQPSL